MMQTHLQRTVVISEPNTSQGTYTTPFPALINIIEQNLDAIAAGGYRPSDMLATVRWMGEQNDIVRLSYRDVNRWFESMRLIEELILGIGERLLITGAFSAGGDRTRQNIRTVT